MLTDDANKRRAREKRSAEMQRTSLSRDDWVYAARAVLEAKGVNNVKVDHLAKQLKVTRGSFYFHFRNRKDLLDALVRHWRERNCEPFVKLDQRNDLGGPALYEAVTDLWLGEGTFRPELDLAMRDWGRMTKAIAQEVSAADEARINLLSKALVDMGFDEEEALVRARISYLHQIGYFAVHFSEPRSARLHYVPLYLKVLTGRGDWKERPVGQKMRFKKSGSR